MEDGTCLNYFPEQVVNEVCRVEVNFYEAYKQRYPAVGGNQVSTLSQIDSFDGYTYSAPRLGCNL